MRSRHTRPSGTVTNSAWHPWRKGGTTPMTASPTFKSPLTLTPLATISPQKSRPSVNGNSMGTCSDKCCSWRTEPSSTWPKPSGNRTRPLRNCFAQSVQNLPVMKTSSGLTDDALTRTITSPGPTMTGDLALLVDTKSSTVPYEWSCHATIFDDHVASAAVVAVLSSVHAVTAVNVVRRPTNDASCNGKNGKGRRNTVRIVFDLAMFHICILFARTTRGRDSLTRTVGLWPANRCQLLLYHRTRILFYCVLSP